MKIHMKKMILVQWELIYFKLSIKHPVFCPSRSALVGPDNHSAKNVLILTMKLWKMKKSCDFDHEIMNFVEKYVGTPAILGRTLSIL
jgi:hypothetical protein